MKLLKENRSYDYKLIIIPDYFPPKRLVISPSSSAVVGNDVDVDLVASVRSSRAKIQALARRGVGDREPEVPGLVVGILAAEVRFKEWVECFVGQVGQAGCEGVVWDVGAVRGSVGKETLWVNVD